MKRTAFILASTLRVGEPIYHDAAKPDPDAKRAKFRLKSRCGHHLRTFDSRCRHTIDRAIELPVSLARRIARPCHVCWPDAEIERYDRSKDEPEWPPIAGFREIVSRKADAMVAESEPAP